MGPSFPIEDRSSSVRTKLLAIEDGRDSQGTHHIYTPSHWEVETTTEKWFVEDRGLEDRIAAREGPW